MAYPQVRVIELSIKKIQLEQEKLATELDALESTLSSVQTLIAKMSKDGISEEAIRAELATRFNATVKRKARVLNKNKQLMCDRVLESVPAEGFITTRELVNITGMTSTKIREALHALISAKQVLQDGDKRAAKYMRCS